MLEFNFRLKYILFSFTTIICVHPFSHRGLNCDTLSLFYLLVGNIQHSNIFLSCPLIQLVHLQPG